jgi:outer membrane receptor protein involved in Fe transport
LRYSHYEIFLPASADSPEARLEPADFSGDLHLVWSLNEQANLVANIGRGFRPPNIFDLGTLGPRPGNRFNIANSNLGPETVWSYDLGVKVASGNWRSELFVFLMDYQDKITSVLTSGFTDSGRAIMRSENRSEVRLHGLEGGFEWLPTPRMTLSGTLNYTHGTEYDGAGGSEPADRTPPLNGRLGVAFQASERLALAAEFAFAGKQDRLSSRDVDDPRINPRGTAGWAALNLRADWQLSESVQLGLNLENLADRAYREHASGVDAPGFNVGAWLNVSF